nr:hypothetical protein [Streptomyces sp. NRRL F-5135]
MAPEEREVGGVVGVPLVVLGAGQGVQVDDGVDAVPCAQIDHSVELCEALLADLERAGVVLEVAVVDRQAQAVDVLGGEQRGVGLVEEGRQEPVEEQAVAAVTDHLPYGGTHRGLIARIAGDEVLHVHPAAEADAAEPDRGAVVRLQPGAGDPQQRVRGSSAGMRGAGGECRGQNGGSFVMR